MVVVSDTSVLIDLERGSLLTASFRLRCGFAVPDLLYERELKPFGGADLRKRGLRVEALDGSRVALAISEARAAELLGMPVRDLHRLMEEPPDNGSTGAV